VVAGCCFLGCLLLEHCVAYGRLDTVSPNEKVANYLRAVIKRGPYLAVGKGAVGGETLRVLDFAGGRQVFDERLLEVMSMERDERPYKNQVSFEQNTSSTARTVADHSMKFDSLRTLVALAEDHGFD
jgi:hypothetical protein